MQDAMDKIKTLELIKPKRRKKKKPRYNFLCKEYIVESDEDADLDYLDELVFEQVGGEDE